MEQSRSDQNKLDDNACIRRGKMREAITATDGHVLTNGKIYGRTIYLADGMDAAAFHEITVEE